MILWWFYAVSIASGFYVQGLGWHGPFETRDICEWTRRHEVESDTVRTSKCEAAP